MIDVFFMLLEMFRYAYEAFGANICSKIKSCRFKYDKTVREYVVISLNAEANQLDIDFRSAAARLLAIQNDQYLRI